MSLTTNSRRFSVPIKNLFSFYREIFAYPYQRHFRHCSIFQEDDREIPQFRALSLRNSRYAGGVQINCTLRTHLQRLPQLVLRVPQFVVHMTKSYQRYVLPRTPSSIDRLRKIRVAPIPSQRLPISPAGVFRSLSQPRRARVTQKNHIFAICLRRSRCYASRRLLKTFYPKPFRVKIRVLPLRSPPSKRAASHDSYAQFWKIPFPVTDVSFSH